MRFKYIFITLIIAFGCERASADDGFLGSQGGNVFLSKSTTISMVKEYVLIRLEKEGFRARCIFWFYNKGKTVNAMVGFPDYSDESLPLSNFSCLVNGNRTDVILKRGISRTPDGDTLGTNFWYAWKAQFRSHDTTVIENEYTGKYGGSVTGIEDVDYVIGTGASWDGPIGQGRIVFNHGGIATTKFTAADFDTFGIKESRMIDSTVFTFNNLIPKKDESIDLTVYCFWGNSPTPPGTPNVVEDSPYKPFVEAFLDGQYGRHRTRQPQSLINEIYARGGYIFRKDSIEKFYRTQHWYKPDPKFTLAKLNRFERGMVSILTELERDRKQNRH